MISRAPLALGLLLSGLVSACGASPASPSSKANDIVLCPVGSTYHAGEGRCVAERAIPAPAPATAPSAAPPTATAPAPAARDATITVKCGFANGWAAVVPADAYPRDDEFVMQALIGFADEPTFWRDQSEYAALEPYKAVRCDAGGATIPAHEGDVMLLVGEADTFAKRNRYSRNGMLKKVGLKKGDTITVDVAPKDLTRTFPCISCPWVHFEGSGRRTAPFVMLARRGSPSERGTDARTLVVPVERGVVRIVVEEHEDEVTTLDALHVDAGGVELAPILAPHRRGARFALAEDDGLAVTLARGTSIVQDFRVPEGTARDGELRVTVRATGHYVAVAR